MPRRKKQLEPEPSLREQAEGHIFQVVVQFEEITGMKVSRIDIVHRRGMGFGAKDTMEVNIIAEQ